MKKFAFLLIAMGSLALSAQDSNSIVTDRPTQSAASTVIPRGKLLTEYGFVYEKVNTSSENITFANFLFRYGLIQGLEFRVIQNILQSGDTFITDKKASGLSPVTIGTKIHLVNENRWIPQTSLITQVTLKNGEPAFRPVRAFPEIRFNFSNTLSEKVSLGYNLGIGAPKEQTYVLYTLMLGYAFAKEWTCFIEPYGFLTGNYPGHSINSGLIYLVSDRFQLDASVGIALTEVSSDYFIGFGAAHRF